MGNDYTLNVEKNPEGTLLRGLFTKIYENAKIPANMASSILNYSLSETEMLRMLDLGANPNFLDANSWSPLHFAVNLRNEEIVILLLKNGAFPNQKTKKSVTPLHFAALLDRLKMVKILLERGADPNQVNEEGKAAIAFAKDPQVKKFLKENTKRELWLEATITDKEGANLYPPSTRSEEFISPSELEELPSEEEMRQLSEERLRRWQEEREES